jgi:hypothetical protein
MAGQPAPSHQVAAESVTPESVEPESVAPESVVSDAMASDSAPASSPIDNLISSPSLDKDPAPEDDSPSNESLSNELIPGPTTSANIPDPADGLVTGDISHPVDGPISADSSDFADSLVPGDISDPADSLVPGDNLASADIPGPGKGSDPADSLITALSPSAVGGDEIAVQADESVSTEPGPASEEIAIPVAAFPENQDPAQAIDLRQIANQPPSTLSPDLLALAESSPPLQRQIPIATPAPLVATGEPKATKPQSATAAGSKSATALPLQLINQLQRKIDATPLVSLGDMLPLLRILTLAALAGIALRFATATLGAIDDLPLVGGLLELVGLVTLLNFLARNAFKQKKRAELLARIQKLRTDLLG